MNANASAPGTGSAGGILSQRYGANYTGTINELNPFQNANYDSLQTQVTYRMAGGSSAGFAWTYSKAIDYADNEDLVECILNNFTDYSLLFSASGQGGSRLDLLHLDPRPLDFRDDALDRGRPEERFRMLIPSAHKFLDRLF
jgi:hypothetical protein